VQCSATQSSAVQRTQTRMHACRLPCMLAYTNKRIYAFRGVHTYAHT
jgi:hypothetical protein